MVLYGMRRPCVTVDRHVARGCRHKGWVDTDDTDAISYRLMCDVPAGLMYDLSLLLLEGVKDGGEGVKDGGSFVVRAFPAEAK